MQWIEESPNVKTVNWGKLKDESKKDTSVLVKMGESIHGKIEKIVEDTSIDNKRRIRYLLRVKGIDEPVLIWSNAAIMRQHDAIEPEEGEEVRFTYVRDYPTKAGNKGRDVRLAVHR